MKFVKIPLIIGLLALDLLSFTDNERCSTKVSLLLKLNLDDVHLII